MKCKTCGTELEDGPLGSLLSHCERNIKSLKSRISCSRQNCNEAHHEKWVEHYDKRGLAHTRSLEKWVGWRDAVQKAIEDTK